MIMTVYHFTQVHFCDAASSLLNININKSPLKQVYTNDEFPAGKEKDGLQENQHICGERSFPLIHIHHGDQ